MKPAENLPVYDLISSQEMVQFMWKYTIHLQTTQIPCAVAFEEELDFSLLARAVNIEIDRNDCLRLRIFRDKGKIRQYFLPEYKLDKIRVKDFETKAELEEYFNADAAKKLDVWGGETFRIAFFRYENKCGIYLITSHMCVDAIATFITLGDLIEVYDSLKNGTPMPRPMAKYEDIIIKELFDEGREKRIEETAAKLEAYVVGKSKNPPMYCGINGRKFLNAERKLTHNNKLTMPSVYMPVPDKSEYEKLFVSEEESAEIKAFVDENRLSDEWVVQAAMRAYLQKINDTDDTYFWVLSPNRRTVKEKKCGGTLASPMPWREILPGDMKFRDAVLQLAESQLFYFRHSEVPFTVMRAMERRVWHLSPMQSPNNMMFSFLPTGNGNFGGRDYEYLGFNMSRYCMPLYTIAIYDKKNAAYKFSYIYRGAFYTQEDVRHFHRGVVKTLLGGVRNPDKTLDEITEGL